MSYTLTLSNGKVFTDLAVSGSCFVSVTELRAEDFAGGMSHVILSGAPDKIGEEEGVKAPYENGVLEHVSFGGVFKADGKWYVYFERPADSELEAMKTRADVDYIAVMTGVEL